MSLPAGQRRALNQIEKALADDHPGLGPPFAVFTRLVGHEAMPATERVAARRRRWRVSPLLVVFVGLAVAMAGLFVLGLMLPGRQVCTSMAAPGSSMQPAHMRAVPAGHLTACAAR